MFKLIPRVRVNYTFGDLIKGMVAGRGKGDKYEQLRKAICNYFGIEDILLTSSGRASIYMLLRYLPQKKVIVPAYTCKVVIEAATMAGKQIVFAPTSRRTFNMSSLPELDAECIVIATHQYGLPCDIEAIVAECRKAGAVVIEDCAASLGTNIKGKKTGLFGDFAIFSFDSSKLVTVPSKGGFIIAKDANLLKSISDATPLLTCSVKYKFKHLMRGFIYVMLSSSYIYRCFHYLTMGRKHKLQIDDHDGVDTVLSEFYSHGFYEWQAVIALNQIKQIEEIIAKRKALYSCYNDLITNTQIEKPEHINDSACIRYAILVKHKRRFYEKCLRHGVDMGFSFNSVVCPVEFDREHDMATDVLNLPYYYNLSDKEQSHIIETINSIKSW